jgi:hypothetical protein
MKNNKEATLKKWGELLDKMGLNDVSTTKIDIARILESDASTLFKEEMEKNNIISDWIDKYGDPEIEKKVKRELETMNKERFYQIIDEVYNKYLTKYVGYDDVPSKELFLFEIKNNTEFSETWGLKIEERELSLEERHLLYCKSFEGASETHKGSSDIDKMTEYHNNRNIPTKLITLTYNNETIESYE